MGKKRNKEVSGIDIKYEHRNAKNIAISKCKLSDIDMSTLQYFSIELWYQIRGEYYKGLVFNSFETFMDILIKVLNTKAASRYIAKTIINCRVIIESCINTIGIDRLIHCIESGNNEGRGYSVGYLRHCLRTYSLLSDLISYKQCEPKELQAEIEDRLRRYVRYINVGFLDSLEYIVVNGENDSSAITTNKVLSLVCNQDVNEAIEVLKLINSNNSGTKQVAVISSIYNELLNKYNGAEIKLCTYDSDKSMYAKANILGILSSFETDCGLNLEYCYLSGVLVIFSKYPLVELK